jgi:pantoate--beta-alanine ligase
MTPVPARKHVGRPKTTTGTVAATPIVRRTEDLRVAIAPWRAAGQRVGLVPTMGALHDGHMALVHRARSDCDRVVVTIFLNPKQFNAAADLDQYPRDLAGDCALLAAAGADLVFAPEVGEMYPDGFVTTVSVAGLTDCLCARARPGHMDGVATVVTKLLMQAQPDDAYFGEKDYQQLLVVRRLVRDLCVPVRIGAVPVVRDADGLALSSRNVFLTPAQRRQAPALYRVLQTAAGRLIAGGDTAKELARAREALAKAGFDTIDYVELRRGDTLAPLAYPEPPARLFAAAWLGQTRLIDNVPVC